MLETNTIGSRLIDRTILKSVYIFEYGRFGLERKEMSSKRFMKKDESKQEEREKSKDEV